MHIQYISIQSHNHPPDAADSDGKQAIDKVKQMVSTSQTTNHRIYCAVTGTLPPATMSKIPGEDAVKKIAHKARRKMNPRPRAQVSLAGLVLEEDELSYWLQVTTSPSRKRAPAGTLTAPPSWLLNCYNSC